MENEIKLSTDEYDDLIRDSEICRILRNVFQSMENVPADFVRLTLDVDYKEKDIKLFEL